MMITAAFTVKDDVFFRKNKYGFAEIQVYDFRVGITNDFDDGPYIFYTEDAAIEKTIQQGVVHEKSIDFDKREFDIDKSTFSGVDKIAVLSDIHGQNDVFLSIYRIVSL